MNLKTAAKWIGRLLMVAAIAFVLKKIYGYREDLLPLLNAQVILVSIGCSIAYGVVVNLIPFIYQNLLRITTGKKLPYTKVELLYCRTNIYKYLPGNVMHYVGRNQLAMEENLSHVDVATATILEIFVTLISSFVIIVLFSWNYAVEWLSDNSVSFKLIIIAAVACVLVLLVLLLVMRRKLIEVLKKYSLLINKKNIAIYVGLIFYNVFTMLLTCSLFLLVLRSVGVVLTPSYLLVTIGLFSLSFLLGYITPGAPGGIGIREAMLTYFLGSIADSSLILAGALIFRIVSILGDVIAYLIALAIVAIGKKNS